MGGRPCIKGGMPCCCGIGGGRRPFMTSCNLCFTSISAWSMAGGAPEMRHVCGPPGKLAGSTAIWQLTPACFLNSLIVAPPGPIMPPTRSAAMGTSRDSAGPVGEACAIPPIAGAPPGGSAMGGGGTMLGGGKPGGGGTTPAIIGAMPGGNPGGGGGAPPNGQPFAASASLMSCSTLSMSPTSVTRPVVSFGA